MSFFPTIPFRTQEEIRQKDKEYFLMEGKMQYLMKGGESQNEALLIEEGYKNKGDDKDKRKLDFRGRVTRTTTEQEKKHTEGKESSR